LSSNGFEVTRCRQNQQTKQDGCSVFLRFSVTGPGGIHPVSAKVVEFSGTRPEVSHDRVLDIEQGATGYIDVTLEFDRNPLDSCTLSLRVGSNPLASFSVRPPGSTQPAPNSSAKPPRQ
jgi:hypothetical protein